MLIGSLIKNLELESEEKNKKQEERLVVPPGLLKLPAQGNPKERHQTWGLRGMIHQPG